MPATFATPLAPDIGFGRRIRAGGSGSAVLGDTWRAALVVAALTLLALAGVCAALLLPRPAQGPPTTSLSPTSTIVAPQVSARH